MEALLQRIDAAWVAVGLFVLALVVYVGANPARADFHDHFVRQADAFLQGRGSCRSPWPT